MNISDVYNDVNPNLFTYAKEVTTPAIIYDIKQLQKVVSEIVNSIKEMPSLKLNFALKACYSPEVLKCLVDLDIGCDVASVYELELAKKAGFKKITTTAPVYTSEDIAVFHNQNIVLDLNSFDQIKLFIETIGNEVIGIRINIPLPEEISNKASFGKDSRFGIDITDKKFSDFVNHHNLKIKRLHVHTGQTTLSSFRYKFFYLLALAEQLKEVDEIILGGGLFYFYIENQKIDALLSELQNYLNEWQKQHKRNVNFYLEPGGAIISPCGYLITTVASSETRPNNKKQITVDSSAWNIAPWSLPVVLPVGKRNDDTMETIIAGRSLYEFDYFGRQEEGNPQLFPLCELSYGDRIIMSSMGGYSMTNARKFNGIPLPSEYIILNDKLIKTKGSFDM